MNRIKKAAPKDFLWSQITFNKLFIELEYLENFRNLKILRTLINLKSTDGKINAKRLGSIAIRSTIAGKLNDVFQIRTVDRFGNSTTLSMDPLFLAKNLGALKWVPRFT